MEVLTGPGVSALKPGEEVALASKRADALKLIRQL